MKHIVSSYIIILFSISLSFAQISFTGPIKVFDIQNVSQNYSVISCMDAYGKTIQFEVRSFPTKNPKLLAINKNKLNNFPIGTYVTVDFNSLTASTSNTPGVKYPLIKPTFSEQCCSITRIDKLENTFNYLMTAKQDTANGITYFIMNGLLGMYPGGKIGQPVYEKYFNNIRYAILKNLNGGSTSNEFVIYSFPFGFMTNEKYYDLKKDGEQADTTPPYFTTPDSLQNIENGYIYLKGPADAECSIKIFKAGTSTLLYSSDTQRIFSVVPGSYNVVISGVRVNGVTLEKAQDARITAGTLDIKSTSDWRLLQNYQTVVYNSSISKKVIFPIGSYILRVNESLHYPKIKDGQILHYGDSSSAPQTQKLNTGAQPWEIKMDATIKGIGGEITMQIPNKLGGRTHMEFYIAGDTKNRVASWFGNNEAKLLPGLYDIVVDGRYTIKNVPVELGKQTRLKMGVFSVSGYGSSPVIENSSSHQKFSYSPPFTILLPEGTYYLNGKKNIPIVIKDGELTEL